MSKEELLCLKQRIWGVEHTSFIPLVFIASGGLANELGHFLTKGLLNSFMLVSK